MLGGISSGTILRGEVTDVYQGGASLKMSFFMNGRLFEGNLSAQQPTVKSSVNHTPSGSFAISACMARSLESKYTLSARTQW
jgi:hypothetical protein